MPGKKEALARKLVESQKALQEFRDQTGIYKGGGEVVGDWSKHEAALVKEISDIKSQLAVLDGHASRP